MKKLINDPARVVPEMLEGLVALAPGLALIEEHQVVVRADAAAVRDTQVALISGGGSGHEPGYAGYVGAGMLSAAVAGDVFTSPASDAVLAAIRAVTGSKGALLIVTNYTGDRLNFGLAAELARAEGLAVETVIVGDDVALAEAAGGAGRRGIAGTVLAQKIAGAAAAAGQDLAAVRAEVEAALQDLGTMGVALTPCTVPAAGEPGFELGSDEVELGLGIHGEAGVRRARLLPADELAAELLEAIIRDRGIARGTSVALLVNNLGGTPLMELAIVARAALRLLEEQGIVVERAYAGTFLTSLEMAGCSLSLMKLDEGRRTRLDAPTDALAWPRVLVPAGPVRVGARRIGLQSVAPRARSERPAGPAVPRLEEALQAVAAALIAAEPELTAMDRVVGDGDLGISLARGARAIQTALPDLDTSGAARAAFEVSTILGSVLGGTSGPLYAVFLLRAAESLAEVDEPGARAWARALAAGCEGIAALGGAGRGDRTMLDALLPAADALEEALRAGQGGAQAFDATLAAARDGVEATRAMTARLGRSSYLGERVRTHPDPGAAAVTVWLEALRPFVADRR